MVEKITCFACYALTEKRGSLIGKRKTKDTFREYKVLFEHSGQQAAI